MADAAPNSPTALDPAEALGTLLVRAIRAAFPALEGKVDPLVTPSKQAALGDYQCNAAMPLAKSLGMKPRDAAAAIVKHLPAEAMEIVEPVTEAAIAGPGFINLKVRGEYLSRAVAAMGASADLGLTPEALGSATTSKETIVVDLMGVNLAKQMHVGHLRSPIIGDALARTFERLGHRVIRQNHVGDWGLPIAMVATRLMRLAKAGTLDLRSITLDTLDTAYRAAQLECQREMAGLEAAKKYGVGPKAIAELEEQVAGATEAFTAARQTLIKLQAGDAECKAVWQRIADVTMAVCIDVCKRLNVAVTNEHSAGESSYAEELAPMVADLESRGVAVVDQGALIVRLDDQHPPGNPYGPIKEPCLIRKTDGGFLYATTDIAAVRRRVQKLGATRAVYAIDARQSLHMQQVYASATKAGYATIPAGHKTGTIARLEHAAFGSVLGEDGRPFKTRSGESVKLQDLLEEMVERARAAVVARSPNLSEAESRRIAEAVGVAAIKYTDLSTDRVKDYVFSFDRMLAFEGNTGPYLLYAIVRIKSIFRKAVETGADVAGWESAAIRFDQPAERGLGLALLKYPGAVRGVAESLEPHRLCAYAYELAGAYSSFYDACPVLTADDRPTRLSRLRLASITARVLEDALTTLGIPVLERM